MPDQKPIVPLIIRGEVITDHLVEIPVRGNDLVFDTPDVHHYADRIPLGHPGKMADLYQISFEDILDFLQELGGRLDIATNAYLQEACSLSYKASPMAPSLVDTFYANMDQQFNREFLRNMADSDIGIDKLEGWVEEQTSAGGSTKVRCFGARTLHIIAGNGPTGTARALIWNALSRGDAIVKSPSNDPFTGPAIVRTMCDMAPDHPLTRHMSVAYWRGGDSAFEERTYQPHNIEKIVAWGGFASVKHVSRYIRPGLELIAMDPKRSASVIGSGAFEDESVMQDAAIRLAADFGGFNQVGCANSRVAYVLTGSDDEGLAKANRFGQLAYNALADFPKSFSTAPKNYPSELKLKVNALRLDTDLYRVIGGEQNEGAVVVSQFPEEVDFMPEMDGRTINIVPIDKLDDFLDAVDSYTQTVGVFPENLKDELLDVLPLYGVQRIVTLGYALAVSMAGPHDAMEPFARMVKWIGNEVSAPDRPPLWR